MLWLHENPGPDSVRETWSRTDIRGGLDMRKVEDARFADFDRDGRLDAVVSATENRSEKVGIHWLTAQSSVHDASAWSGNWLVPEVRYQFIKLALGQIDGRNGEDIVVGSKSDNKPARLIWYQSPLNPNPGNLDQWRAHEVATIGWVDSVDILDVNGDGRPDILMNYKHHLAWYENPGDGADNSQHWVEHMISTSSGSYYARCNGAESAPAALRLVVGADIAVSAVGDAILWSVSKELDEKDRWTGRWLQHSIKSTDVVPRDPEHEDYAIKSIACGNLDGDDRPDIVVSTSGRGHGVFALMNMRAGNLEQTLEMQVIASATYNSYKGIKHDDVRLADVDLDGDLDIVTTEENGSRTAWWSTRGLGLIWYENTGSAAH